MYHNLIVKIKSYTAPPIAKLYALFQKTSTINTTLIILGLSLFLPRLHLELKLDELGSFWVIKDSLRDTIDRSLHLGQSPFYYLILWLSYKLLGASEIALRIPSLICILSSSILMIRLGTALFSREVGVFAAFTFLGSIQAIVAATDARPYALSIFFTVLSTIYLVEWCKTASKRSLTFYCLSVIATVYAHYLFGLILVCHAIWVILHFNNGRKTLVKQSLVAGTGLIFILLPALHHVREFSANTAGKAFVKSPQILDLLGAMIPTESLVLAILIFTFSMLAWRVPKPSAKPLTYLTITWDTIATLAIFLVMPVLIIYAVSIFSGNSIFVERYFGQRILGVGLLGGVMICSIRQISRRIILLSCFLILLSINQYSYGFSGRAGDGFGRAVNQIKAEDASGKCQLLVMSGFIEAQTIGWLTGGLTRDFILSPLSYYRVNNPITPIPYSFNTLEATQYYADVVRQALEVSSCVWLLYRNVELYVTDQDLTPSPIAIEQELVRGLGFHESHRTVHGFVELIGYTSNRMTDNFINLQKSS